VRFAHRFPSEYRPQRRKGTKFNKQKLNLFEVSSELSGFAPLREKHPNVFDQLIKPSL
jgi:hypothetical protein